MINTLRKPKILIATIALVVMLSFGLSVAQNQVIGVSAQLHPIMFVAPPVMEFGLSFPQEKRTAEFVVVGKWSYPELINYIITHGRKMLPPGYEGDGEDQQLPGYYRNLCPYLAEATEEPEPDYPWGATLNPPGGQDLVDYWLLTFDVPTIKGYVDQGFIGTPIDAPGDYGCDVKIAFFQGTYCGDGVKQSPNQVGLGGPNNDGYEDCDGEDGVPEGDECTANCVLIEGNNPHCHPAVEICDGQDNDCDGQIDEGELWQNKGQSCSVGQGQCQRSGTYICDSQNPAGATICSAIAGSPSQEICDNNIDDDCDGATDSADSDCEEVGPESSCGNQICETGESCQSCPQDCDCPPLDIAISSGGGGGAGSIGLYIHTEATAGANTTLVLITWFTNHPATSRVVYDTISHSVLGSPPNYGYQWSTPIFDTDPKVTFHQVEIQGLLEGVTYYFRPISAASPEILGDELTYTVPKATAAISPEESKEEAPAPVQEGVGGMPPVSEEAAGKQIPSGVGEPVILQAGQEPGQILGEEATSTPTTTAEVAPTSENEQATTTPVFGGFLPGFCCNFWCVIIIIIILLILFYFYNKNKEGKKP